MFLPFFVKKISRNMQENKENINKTEKELLNLLSGEPIVFEINIEKPTLINRLRKVKTKKYSIKPLNLDKSIKIAKLLNEVKHVFTELDNFTVLEKEAVLADYYETFLKIVSVFIDEKTSFINKNFTVSDVTKLIFKILEIKQTAFFLNTLNILNQTMSQREAGN